MAGRFWFKKRDGDDSESGSNDSSASTGVVVMTDDVFPMSFGDTDEEQQRDDDQANQVLDEIKRNAELLKRNVTRKNSEPTGAEQSVKRDMPEVTAEKTEEKKVNSVDKKNVSVLKNAHVAGIFATRLGAESKPVMTPVRMAPKTAPIKLKSVSETREAETKSPAQSSEQRVKVVNTGLKVVGGSVGADPAANDKPKFALHLNKPEAPAAPAAASDNSVNEGVKPKTDQRALYYQLMNGLYDAILVLDDHGHVVDCNDRVNKVLGYSREDAWDLPVEKIIKGMNSQMFAHLKRNLEENHNVLITARCYKSDGTSFKGEVGVSTLSLTRENNVVFAVRNVDQRKSAMDELRKSAAAFQVALVPAFVCSSDGFFTNVNQALLQSFNIPNVEEAFKVRFIDLLPDAMRYFAKALSGEQIREKFTVNDAQGQVVNLEISLAPIKNGNEVSGVAGSLMPL